MTSRETLRAALLARYLDERAQEARHGWRHWSTAEMETISETVEGDLTEPTTRPAAVSFLGELATRRLRASVPGYDAVVAAFDRELDAMRSPAQDRAVDKLMAFGETPPGTVFSEGSAEADTDGSDPDPT